LNETPDVAGIRARNRRTVDLWLAGDAFVDAEKGEGDVWYEAQEELCATESVSITQKEFADD
jgi:hypothetical protein